MRKKEDIQKDIERAERKQRYLMGQEKLLLKQAKELERRNRSRRLIERGAILEEYLKQPLILPNDQIIEILNEAFSLTGTRVILENIIREAEERAANSVSGDDIA